jgi:hypothetical protein
MMLNWVCTHVGKMLTPIDEQAIEKASQVIKPWEKYAG